MHCEARTWPKTRSHCPRTRSRAKSCPARRGAPRISASQTSVGRRTRCRLSRLRITLVTQPQFNHGRARGEGPRDLPDPPTRSSQRSRARSSARHHRGEQCCEPSLRKHRARAVPCDEYCARCSFGSWIHQWLPVARCRQIQSTAHGREASKDD